MKRIAVFAGSFCPFTKGHEDIVNRAKHLFDKIIIAIGHNPAKKNLFSIEERMQWISKIYDKDPCIEVRTYEGLTVDFCKKEGAKFLIRGVRNAFDITTENDIALINKELCDNIETIVFFANPKYHILSSSFVRELWLLNQDYSKYISYKLPERQ